MSNFAALRFLRFWIYCLIFHLMGLAINSNLLAQFFSRVIDAGPISTDAFLSTGASWTDINDDGWPDLYAMGETTIRFYLNNQDGTFSSRTGEDFVTSQGVGNIGIWADYDNDGYLDLFLGNTTTQPGGNTVAPNFLYRNEGPPLHSMTVVDIGNAMNASPSASWIDYDRDGDVDLFSAGAATSSGTGTPDLFYRNDGNSVFTHLEDLSLLKTRTGIGTHDVWIDYDNDSDQDLFVLNWSRPNELYKSLLQEKGNPNLFEPVSSNGLLDEGSFFDISSNWGDYDNDGDFDVFVAFTNNTTDRLYHNNGDGTFTRLMNNPIVSEAQSTTMGIWGDYDNDGDLDLFVANIQQNPTKPALYRNEGNGQFVTTTQTELGDILDNIPAPQGGYWGDYDNDGDLDLYVLTYAIPNNPSGAPQPNYLFRNDQGNSNHWLNVKCEGQLSNRSAIHAKISAKAMIANQPVWQTRYVSGGASSFVFQAELRTHFGLGDATTVDSLRIEWPSGVTQVLENVAVDQFLTVNEEIPSGFLRANFYAAQTTSPDTSTYAFQFVDVSLSDPNVPVNSRNWDFDNDGQSDSQDLNPTWTYTTSRRTRFPVKLTISNGTSSSELLREDYIEVGPRPDTQVDTQRLAFSFPSNSARVDTSFNIYNAGQGADSVFAAISDYGAADSNAVMVSPTSLELASGDSMRISFTVLPSLLAIRSYVTRVAIRSKYNSGVQDFNKLVLFQIETPTAIRQKDEGLPKTFALLQNHPNPFNASTLIRFDLPNNAHVVLTIHNILGQEIAILVNGEQTVGRYSVRWDGKDFAGRNVSSGVYVYRIQTEQLSKTKKLLLLQ